MDLKLTAQRRELAGKKVRKLRADGGLPGVVYGRRDTAVPVLLDAHDFGKVFARAGRSHLIDLDVHGDGGAYKVIVKEVQRHPRRLGPQHVDFYRVDMTEKIRVEIPVVIHGEAPAVEQGLGDLQVSVHDVEVECLTGDIPERLVADVSGLTEVDAAVRVGDLELPAGVELVTNPEEVVVKVAAPTSSLAEAEEEAALGEEGEAAEAESEEPPEGTSAGGRETPAEE
jgi:large subunit ribosomal protein L25